MRRILFVLCLGASQHWGASPICLKVPEDQSRSRDLNSPSFSTTSLNELSLAFVRTDASSAATSVANVRGATLTWVALAFNYANERRRNVASLCSHCAFNLT
jgi:hypothetical protein